jgi:hypothetical protein
VDIILEKKIEKKEAKRNRQLQQQHTTDTDNDISAQFAAQSCGSVY